MNTALLSFAFRDLRNAGRPLVVLCACLVLAVTLITATGGLFYLVRDALLSDTRALFGGDVELRDRQRIDAPVLDWLNERAEVSLLVELRTMAAAEDGQLQIVQVQAVDDAYPLYGNVELMPAMPVAEALAMRDGVFGAAFDPALAESLGLTVGDQLEIGALKLELRASIKRQPDRALRATWRGPPILIAQTALEQAELLVPGARSSWRYRTRLTGTPDRFIAQLNGAFPDSQFEIRTFEGRGTRIAEVLGQLASGLLLVAFSALFIGGLGIFNSVHAYLQGKLATLATLRALGLRDANLSALYLAQVVALAGLASLAGVVVGGALAVVGAGIVRESLPLEFGLGALLWPAVTALTLGVLTAITFALPALGKAVAVSPAILFRGDTVDAPPVARRYLAGTAVCGAALAAMVLAVLPDTLFAAGFVVTILALLGGFELLVRLLKAIAPRVAEHPALVSKFAFRLALANLYRPGSPLRPLLLSLGSALTLLVATGLVVMALHKTIEDTIPADSPDLVFYDIGTDQLDLVRETLAQQTTLERADFAPLVLGRLETVNDEALRLAEDVKRALESRDEHKLTYRGANIDDVAVRDGAWWPADYSGPPVVAMEDREADQLGLAVGDRLVFEIMGERVETQLVAIFSQRRHQARFWFEAMFSDGTLEPFITRHVGTASLGDDDVDASRRALARSAPNIVTIDIRNILDEASQLLGKAAAGLAVVAAVSLAASALVLAGVVASARTRQVHEAVLLHTLGARIDVIRKALQLEYALMAVVASLVAVLLGTVIAGALLHYRLQLPVEATWWLAAAIALGASTLALASGARYVIGELRLVPATLLRAQG
ncbi:MAG: FtsX-like permease family protein [Pseudomonadota bacterium]